MSKKETIRISFEVSLHEARITRHWLAKQRLDLFPTGSIAKTMHSFQSAMTKELNNLPEEEE